MCPLFGGKRDISLFRKLNRELINRIIHVDVGIYKLVLDDTKTNVYGEAPDKVYYKPLKCPVLVGRDGQSYEGNEFGTDYTAQSTFAFLRDDLKLIDLLPEVGDILVWDNEYYELDVSQFIYELIILSVPTKKVHPKVLDGTMNSEALNKLRELEIKKNKSSSNEDVTDPRWDKLKSLITEKKT